MTTKRSIDPDTIKADSTFDESACKDLAWITARRGARGRTADRT